MRAFCGRADRQRQPLCSAPSRLHGGASLRLQAAWLLPPRRGPPAGVDRARGRQSSRRGHRALPTSIQPLPRAPHARSERLCMASARHDGAVGCMCGVAAADARRTGDSAWRARGLEGVRERSAQRQTRVRARSGGRCLVSCAAAALRAALVPPAPSAHLNSVATSADNGRGPCPRTTSSQSSLANQQTRPSWAIQPTLTNKLDPR